MAINSIVLGKGGLNKSLVAPIENIIFASDLFALLSLTPVNKEDVAAQGAFMKYPSSSELPASALENFS